MVEFIFAFLICKYSIWLGLCMMRFPDKLFYIDSWGIKYALKKKYKKCNVNADVDVHWFRNHFFISIPDLHNWFYLSLFHTNRKSSETANSTEKLIDILSTISIKSTLRWSTCFIRSFHMFFEFLMTCGESFFFFKSIL